MICSDEILDDAILALINGQDEIYHEYIGELRVHRNSNPRTFAEWLIRKLRQCADARERIGDLKVAEVIRQEMSLVLDRELAFVPA